MDRRNFLKQSATVTLGSLVSSSLLNASTLTESKQILKTNSSKTAPRAITMWDFSWLERRWPGAGYENWDIALNELVERGYNAIRLDAYPHLLAADPKKKWLLKEVWNQQTWGSPDMNEVQIQPYLNEFLFKCSERDIKVGLSSWFRQDVDDTRMKLTSPDKMADCWITTLKAIEKEGLMDTVLYVDLCNEFPGDAWAPYFPYQYPNKGWGEWYKKESLDWMEQTVKIMKKHYPDIPFMFSFDSDDLRYYEDVDSSFLDFYEPHIWMAQRNGGEFDRTVGYDYGRFTPEGYKNLARNGERVYREKQEYWQSLLVNRIHQMGDIARRLKRPLMTTECWAVVDYKDWPLMKWDWVKELCALGATTAAETGMWVAVATSNFCGPQFVGMWRDVKWHQQLTSIIRSAKIDESLIKDNEIAAKLIKRL
ncbi:cellulase-like family protein [Bacteroides sp.]|uniref:cellulase-like family protein n=1 Tax=Bacteroides sp. TaxID=29523 RepID=UPI0026335C76|nr:cellulase-like family protein [Bacteroides sp.]